MAKKRDALARIAAHMAQVPVLRGDKAPLESWQKRLLAHWGEHPWNWLSGEDETGRQLIWTKDERATDEALAVRPFPRDKEYLRLLVETIHNEKMVFIDKARQMYVSTTILLYMDWLCRFRKARRCILSKSTEDEAKEMLRDKVRFPSTQLPAWVQRAVPQSKKPAIRTDYPLTGSYILAAAENVANREARGGTASVVSVDEAAFQMLFGDILGAVQPMAAKIIATTTAQVGPPGSGAAVFKEWIEDKSVHEATAGELDLREL